MAGRGEFADRDQWRDRCGVGGDVEPPANEKTAMALWLSILADYQMSGDPCSALRQVIVCLYENGSINRIYC